MTTPNTKMITYKDFSGGEFGDLGPFRAPANTFTGTNVVLYSDGLLGPRPGLHLNQKTAGDTMNGKIWGIFNPGRINKPLIVFVDDKVYSTTQDNISLDTVTHVATLDATPTDYIKAAWYDPNTNIYFTSPNDKCYYIDWATNALNPLPVANLGADNDGTHTIFLCKDRLYAAGGSLSAGFGNQKVYVSAAADFTNFSGGEYFDVGYFNSVRSMCEAQNSLMFSVLEASNNNSGVGWYSLVGATPSGSLRRVNVNLATEGQHEVVPADNGNIYFWSGWSTSETDSPTLCSTNGAKFDEDTHWPLSLTGADRFGVYNAPDKTIVYTSDQGNNGYTRQNYAWSKMHFEVPVSGPVCLTEGAESILITYGAAGEDVKVYEYATRYDKPAAATGMTNPGDNSNTPLAADFTLPAFQSDNKDMRVRRIIVDFKKWNTVHADINNKLKVNLFTYGQYNLPGGSTDGGTITSQTWEENQALSDSNGTLDRYVARIGQQGKCAGFIVGISEMKGVAIESITVEYDEDDPEGRTL